MSDISRDFGCFQTNAKIMDTTSKCYGTREFLFLGKNHAKNIGRDVLTLRFLLHKVLRIQREVVIHISDTRLNNNIYT